MKKSNIGEQEGMIVFGRIMQCGENHTLHVNEGDPMDREIRIAVTYHDRGLNQILRKSLKTRPDAATTSQPSLLSDEERKAATSLYIEEGEFVLACISRSKKSIVWWAPISDEWPDSWWKEFAGPRLYRVVDKLLPNWSGGATVIFMGGRSFLGHFISVKSDTMQHYLVQEYSDGQWVEFDPTM